MPGQLHQQVHDKGPATGDETVVHDPLVEDTDIDRVAARAAAEQEERDRMQAMAAQQDRMASGHREASAMSSDQSTEDSGSHSAPFERGSDATDKPDTTAESTAIAVALGVGAALIKAQWIPGILIGAGAVLLGRMYPQMGPRIRPAVKAMVSTGLSMTEQVRGMAGDVAEQMRQVIAEVQSERERERNNRRDTTPHEGQGTNAEREARETATAP